MQLDNTRIAVRERGMIDTLDLTFHVMRGFAPRLIPALLLGIVPLAVVNYFLVGWMWETPAEFDFSGAFRYFWHYCLLVFFQAPIATIFAEAYLGGAVFKHDKTLREVIREVRTVFWPLVVCQLLLRGTLLAMAVPLLVYGQEFNPVLEVVLLPLLALVAAGLRAFRPYINEIVVLERNPLRSRQVNAMTVGKRSAFLHGTSSGDLFAQWLGTILVVVALGNLVYWSLYAVFFLMFGSLESLTWVPRFVLLPVALWSVVAFIGVARFLSYLDLRIRQEGWEVELLIKAEAARLAAKLV
jgi:hypothetical protein